MKAFIAGVAAIVVISIGAAVVLNSVEISTAQTYSTQNVRLGH